jgi:hypothetical protein
MGTPVFDRTEPVLAELRVEDFGTDQRQPRGTAARNLFPARQPSTLAPFAHDPFALPHAAFRGLA